MDIDKLIEEKTECFTGNGDYYFTYVTPEDCKKIVEEALKQSELLKAFADWLQSDTENLNYDFTDLVDEYLESL